MRKILMIFFVILIIFISNSCIHHASIQFDVPQREELPDAIFSKCDSKEAVQYCTTTNGIKALIKRDTIRDAYEKKLVNTVNSCNEVLK